MEVSFNLVAPTNLDAGQQAQAMEQFSALINSGQLSLQDLDGNSLDVPSQCVQNCPVEIIGRVLTLTRVEHSHWSGGSRSCSHWSRPL